MAGYSVAREIRRLDPEHVIAIVTEEGGGYYYKPAISNALRMKKTASALVMKDLSRLSTELGAQFVVGEAERVDAADNKVVLKDGTELGYENLVLATGSQPRKIELAAADHHVFDVNSLAQYGRLREHLQQGMRIAVIGSGMIGCEIAEDLLQHGVKPLVITPDAYPLQRMLPVEIGTRLETILEAAGVEWYCAMKTMRVSAEGSAYAMSVDEGTSLSVDAFLVAAGQVPRTELAKAAGIRTSLGIVVDECGLTSVPNIYALGDCAEYTSGWLPYIAPISFASKAVALSITGQATKMVFPPMPVKLKTHTYPISLLPPVSMEGVTAELETTVKGQKLLYKESTGAICGFVLAGEVAREADAIAKTMTLAT